MNRHFSGKPYFKIRLILCGNVVYSKGALSGDPPNKYRACAISRAKTANQARFAVLEIIAVLMEGNDGARRARIGIFI